MTSTRDAGQTIVPHPQDLGPQSPENTTATVATVGGTSVMATGWTISVWVQSIWTSSGQWQQLYYTANKESGYWNPFFISINNFGSVMIEQFYNAPWMTSATSTRCYVQSAAIVPSGQWVQLTIAQNQRGEFTFWINDKIQAVSGPSVCAPLETQRTAAFVGGTPLEASPGWRSGLWGQLAGFSMWPRALSTA